MKDVEQGKAERMRRIVAKLFPEASFTVRLTPPVVTVTWHDEDIPWDAVVEIARRVDPPIGRLFVCQGPLPLRAGNSR